MKSAVLPSFWVEYRRLSSNVRQSAKKVYQLWAENPFHPSLHFKCINSQEGIWSARVTRDYRALEVLEGDTVTWFWIGAKACMGIMSDVLYGKYKHSVTVYLSFCSEPSARS